MLSENDELTKFHWFPTSRVMCLEGVKTFAYGCIQAHCRWITGLCNLIRKHLLLFYSNNNAELWKRRLTPSLSLTEAAVSYWQRREERKGGEFEVIFQEEGKVLSFSLEHELSLKPTSHARLYSEYHVSQWMRTSLWHETETLLFKKTFFIFYSMKGSGCVWCWESLVSVLVMLLLSFTACLVGPKVWLPFW